MNHTTVESSLATRFPRVAQMVDLKLNPGVDVYAVPAYAKVRLNFSCDQGQDHVWEGAVAAVVQGQSCLVCSGHQVLQGVNDLATTHPELANQWHPTLNEGLLPSDVTARRSLPVFWLCSSDHPFSVSPGARVQRGRGCGVCSNKTLLVGVNDLATTHAGLAKEWHPTLNEDLTPSDVISGSHQKVWWIGPCGHDFFMAISRRTPAKPQGCSICAGKRVLVGTNDFASRYPELATEWHPTKNQTLTPDQVTSGSARNFWWLGACGHEFTASPKQRGKGKGCPYCARSNTKVLVGFNDLATLHPNLVAEWHPTSNGDLSPADRMSGSKKPVWWLCKDGHAWEATPDNRTRAKSGCSTCWAQSSVSRAETEVADFVKSLPVGDVVTSSRQIIEGSRFELDIYVPEKQLAVEYNGLYWHSEAMNHDKQSHYRKWLACKNEGIQLVQVWEDEWARNPDQVKRMLAHKLGVPYGDEERVMARKTHAVTITKAEAEVFLDENHVQGHANGTYYLALMRKDVPAGTHVQDDLLAVLVLRNEAGTEGRVLNIIRYATAAVIPGGFTKLLTHAERTYFPDGFITFSDHCVSDGGLYANNGFVADAELNPDYMYVVNGERRHKFGYRLKRFRNDPDLLWEEGLTERELATLNGLHRVWDAGKTRWVKTVKQESTD